MPVELNNEEVSELEELPVFDPNPPISALRRSNAQHVASRLADFMMSSTFDNHF